MHKDTILSYLEEIVYISCNPLYEGLEVGFRHGPLSLREQVQRYQQSLDIINVNVLEVLRLIREEDELETGQD